MSRRRRLLIDTDAGVDDAVALCMAMKLAARHDFDLRLLTLSFGNCSLDKVCLNVAKCCAACGFLGSPNGPRIVQGASRTITGQEPVDASYFHGEDGLGDADVPDPPLALLPPRGKEDDAALAIIAECHAAAAAREAITIVLLGPLTNMALALRQDPGLPQLVDHVIFMGCCGNGRGNCGRVTEFNVYADPEAAAEVFAASWPDLLVASWELAVQFPVPWSVFDRMLYEARARRTEVGKFMAAVCHLPYVKSRGTTPCSSSDEAGDKKATPCCFGPLQWLLGRQRRRSLSFVEEDYVSLPGSPPPGAIICDALAVAIALRPEVIRRTCKVHVEVELKGSITRGQTVVDWGTCADSKTRQRTVRWAEEVDRRAFIKMLRETVNSD